MFGSTAVLTLVTLTGLAAGFAREWLLVASWGAGARTDGFLIAMFLPEAVRAILAAGVLSSAALSIWQAQPAREQPRWLGTLTAGTGLGALLGAALLAAGAPLWVALVGPGLDAAQRDSTEAALRVLAWSLPGTVCHALWSVPLQAGGRFVLAGLGSLLYNLPAIAYMALMRERSTETGLAAACVAGSLLMGCALAPSAWRIGLRPRLLVLRLAPLREVGMKLWPLLVSAGLGQGLLLLERVAASFMGEGAVTILNLARKLINLPLVALMSLNQVLLGLMSGRAGHHERLDLLARGLATATMLALPAAIGLILAAHALIELLFPNVPGTGPLPTLLAGYAVALVVASWNAMLARYNYAAGDTRGPLASEMAGSLAQAAALPLLAWALGPLGIVLSTLVGTVLTGHLMMRANRLWGQVGLARQVAAAVVLLAGGALLHGRLGTGAWQELAAAAGVGALCAGALALWLQPWRGSAAVAEQRP